MLSIGKKVVVQSYKHDKTLHRIWQEATVLHEDDEKIVVANKRTKVIEANGRFWFTKEPSVTYFFKHQWYNVIGIIKPTGISYYCNLSSPITYDQEALKYIDYDLDVKVSIDHLQTLLDQNEYKKHQAMMAYPKEITGILEQELQHLQRRIVQMNEPFQPEVIQKWYTIFQTL
jgi:protein associated with RNAse G/E